MFKILALQSTSLDGCLALASMIRTWTFVESSEYRFVRTLLRTALHTSGNPSDAISIPERSELSQGRSSS